MSLLDLSFLFFMVATLVKIVTDFEKHMNREPEHVPAAVRPAHPVTRRPAAARRTAISTARRSTRRAA